MSVDKLKDLMSRCKCGVYVSVNEHRDLYTSVEQQLIDDCVDAIDPGVRAKMIETDTYIRVQFYPHTPIGFHLVFHYDLDTALDIALSSCREDDRG